MYTSVGIMKCTNLKYTVRWTTALHMYPKPLSVKTEHCHHPREFLHIPSQSVFTQAPQEQPLCWFCSPQKRFVFWGVLYKWNHTICTFLCKASFTWDSLYVLFYCLVILRCVWQNLFILLVVAWAISSSGLLRLKLLWIFLY